MLRRAALQAAGRWAGSAPGGSALRPAAQQQGRGFSKAAARRMAEQGGKGGGGGGEGGGAGAGWFKVSCRRPERRSHEAPAVKCASRLHCTVLASSMPPVQG